MKFENGKLWSNSVCSGTVEIRTLTESDLESALDILDESFFNRECVCIGCEIDLPQNDVARKELRELCRITAQDGASIVAKDILTGRLIGVAFNKIQSNDATSNEEPFFINFRKNCVQSSNAKCLMDYMISMDSELDIFQTYNIDCICEVMFLATISDYGQKGIGENLVKHSIELARNWMEGIDVEYVEPSLRKKHPKVVTALLTSIYSQKIGRALGFEVLNTVPYSRFLFNGKTFDQRIGEVHKYSELVALRL